MATASPTSLGMAFQSLGKQQIAQLQSTIEIGWPRSKSNMVRHRRLTRCVLIFLDTLGGSYILSCHGKGITCYSEGLNYVSERWEPCSKTSHLTRNRGPFRDPNMHQSISSDQLSKTSCLRSTNIRIGTERETLSGEKPTNNGAPKVRGYKLTSSQ